MSEGFPWEDPLKELPHEQRAMHKNTIVPICSNHSDSEFIKNQIKLNAELHRECQEEYKQLQKDVDRIREEMKRLKTIMNIAKANVVKLEELIKDEVR